MPTPRPSTTQAQTGWPLFDSCFPPTYLSVRSYVSLCVQISRLRTRVQGWHVEKKGFGDVFTWGPVPPRSINSCLNSVDFDFVNVSPALHMDWRISDHLGYSINSEMWCTKIGIISEHLETRSSYINSNMWCTKNGINFRPFGNRIQMYQLSIFSINSEMWSTKKWPFWW